MKKKWVESLVSRLHGNDHPLILEVEEDEWDEVIEGMLWTGKGRSDFGFPIREGVPQFFPSYFEDEFGSKWEEWSRMEGWDSGLARESAILQFCSTLGVGSLANAQFLFKDGSNWLDAGCGVGQAESLFNLNSKANRFAVDLSPITAKVAYEKTKHLPNVFVGQANLISLPFKRDYFDGVFSMGVIHHTPDPRLSFRILCSHLKAGGLMGIYVYCKKPFIRELVDEKLRGHTWRMDEDDCLEFSEHLALLGYSLSKYREPLEIHRDIPLLGIKKGSYELQKFIYDHFLKCYYNPGMSFSHSKLNNFDWYHPRYASHHTRGEIQSWFDENGIENVKFIQPEGWEHSGYFVSGRKKK